MTHPINSYQNCDDESHVHPYETNAEAKHEELLANINAAIRDRNADYGLVKGLYALRSVVELHSPDYDEVNGDVCPQCSEGEYWTPYPCITIEAIEKALV